MKAFLKLIADVISVIISFVTLVVIGILVIYIPAMYLLDNFSVLKLLTGCVIAVTFAKLNEII